MAYVDAGTIIMILPFLIAVLFLCGRDYRYDLVRLVFVTLVAIAMFLGMIIQEQGMDMIGERLNNWASYYFHNLNTFSMFWIYTDHKILYLITAVAMSGVIVGFWKNRKFERVSPWLLSMLFIFATVPFMGATRMNTQAFVTVYYAFILGCVASLIITPSEEIGEYVAPELSREDLEKMEQMSKAPDELSDDSESQESETQTTSGISDVVTPETESEDKNFTTAEVETEEDVEAVVPDQDVPYEPEPEPEPRQRFVPEGMVLPEDDEDADLTPRMKMPAFSGAIGLMAAGEKLKVMSKESEPEPEPVPEPKDDFDIEFTAGDDFDI
jgi:hypothetical protein